jgi:hypothetical protein
MDKIMSARVNEDVINKIGGIARHLKISRKAVIENAIKNYAQQIDNDKELDIFTRTCGSWKRNEPVNETIQKIRGIMRQSQERYKKG